MIQEALKLYGQLALDQPAAFNPYLTVCLITLSNSLSHLGHPEDALTAIQEAIELYRQLTEERPVTFNPHLEIASSLNNLSSSLTKLGC